MSTFVERHDLKNIKVTSDLLRRIGTVHASLQNIEAGLDSTDLDKAKATFEFFEVFGLYPTSADLLGKKFKLAFALERSNGYYRVIGFVKNPIPEVTPGEYLPTNSMSMFGPGSAFSKRSLPTTVEVERVIKAAFPKAVINKAFSTAKDGTTKVEMVSVRSQFMQGHGDNFPVPAGTSTCSYEPIAFMQAAVRMLHSFVVDAHRQNTYDEMRGYREEAKKTRLGKMYGMGQMKYGTKDWEASAKRLLDAMFPKTKAPTLVELVNRIRM